MRSMRFPSLSTRSLMFWTGYHGSRHFDQLDLNVVSSIATSLHNADLEATTIKRTHELGLGLLLEGQAWRNQMPPTDACRKDRFEKLGFARGKERYNADGASLSPRESFDYASAFVEEQVKAGASIVGSPGHVGRDAFGQARYNDLQLARDASDAFWAAGFDQPDAKWGIERRVFYLTIALEASTVEDKDVPLLVEAYRTLSCDGYIVNFFNYAGQRGGFERCASLVNGLQRASGRPVVVSGLSNLWIGALALGASTALVGPQRLAPEFIEVPAHSLPESQERKTPVFRGEVLSAFSLKAKGEAQLKRSLMTNPCKCGTHDKHGFAKDSQRVDHNVAEIIREARLATSGSPEQAISRLTPRVHSARSRRSELDMSPLRSAWSAVAEPRKRAQG